MRMRNDGRTAAAAGRPTDLAPRAMGLPEDGRRLLDARVAGLRGVQAARASVRDLVAAVADPARARRIEAELNDAWLRLQFARMTDDPARIEAERATCERLLREAQGDGAARRPS